ncbi:Hypothetical protein R9X50_00453800 [Acrodontium crateriforme]|uniref:Rhodopsin domain-containing protein n=1 Tax=Acrodontium crateriforme TaxID=150365 RepID=A0AAQ3R553_9PEZI|nr:Hypothetical protein R9X50_00453800 [Acrodontium crateriforme]
MAGDYAGDKVITATVLAFFCSVTAVALRIFARQYQHMKQYPEDYFIYIGLAFKIAIDVAGVILLCNGLGKHITMLGPSQLTTFLKTQYTGSFLYAPCITCIKLSLLAQYRRMFKENCSRTFIIQINILMGIVVAWCAAIVIASAFICVPIYKLWTLDRVVNGTCINLDKFYYGIQIPNLVTDVLIIILPIREMTGLHLSRRVKLGATAMFLLGIITVVFGTVRLVALVRLDGKGPDLTYNEVYAAIWTTVEPAAAIVAVCIPSVRTLYRNQRERSRIGSSRDQTSKNSSARDKWSNGLRSSESNNSEGRQNKCPRTRSGDGSKTGWVRALRTRPDELPHIAHAHFRVSEESETGFIELGMAPGHRAESVPESIGTSKPYVSEGYSPTNYQHQFVAISN